MKIRASFVTNSSSGCFVCFGEGLTVEGVKKDLEVILGFYNSFFDRSREFHDVFEEPVIAVYADQARINHHLIYRGPEYARDDIKGKIIIYTADDNSVPSVLENILDEKFNTCYFHFG